MLDYAYVAIVIVLFMVILMMLSMSDFCNVGEEGEAEHFDTYWNHDMGVHTIQQKTNPDISVDESVLKAKYTWKAQDKAGENNTDKYYEDMVLEKNAGYYPPEVYYNMNSDYDTKFVSLPGGGYKLSEMQGSQMNKNFYHPGMTDPTEAYGIGLSEKIDWA